MPVNSSLFSFAEITDRPSARGYRAVVIAIGLYLAVAIGVVPFASISLPVIPAITPLVVATVLATDLSSSFLLFVMAVEARKLSFLILGCAYFYAALMAVLHLLTFPGLIVQNAVALGTFDSAGWAFPLWMAGFALFSLASIIYETTFPQRQFAQIRTAVAVGTILTLLLVTGMGVAVTRFIQAMPPLMTGMRWNDTSLVLLLGIFVIQALTAVLSLSVAARRSRIFLWLGLVLVAMMVVNGITLVSGARNTLGWSFGRASWIVSACVLFLFFMGQFANQLRFLMRTKGTLEQLVQERTAELTQALKQRDLLLREVYHRVKNNMQIVDSMLFLERRRCDEAATKAMIDVLRERFYALGLVHQQLMTSSDMEHFDIAPFLHELVENLNASARPRDDGVTLKVTSAALKVTLDTAIPIGLLVTELVTNSVRHADARHIAVSLTREGEDYAQLVVADDGGDREPVAPTSTGLSTGFGSLIVSGLVNQLDGRLDITRDRGLRAAILFPLSDKA